MPLEWKGIFPAVSTQIAADESVDFDATAKHIEFLIENGVSGLVMLGTVGENSTMTGEEKREIVKHAVETANGRAPVVAGVAEASTRTACAFAEDAIKAGADGLMVLPGMIYRQDAREVVTHFQRIARAVPDAELMIYNNPVSYNIDIKPDSLKILAEEKNYIAIKESSDDPRRLTDIYNECDDRFILFCGVDDIALESFLLGAVGWISGVANAFPAECVKLYELAQAGEWEKAREIYRWFMPVMHLDTFEKLVQYLKLADQMVGVGSENVRAPRLILEGEERDRIKTIINTALENRPDLSKF